MAFLHQWRSEVASPRFPQEALSDDGVAQYLSRVHEFHGEAARVRDAIKNTDTFNRLVDTLGALKAEKLREQHNTRRVILEAIDALIQFVQNA